MNSEQSSGQAFVFFSFFGKRWHKRTKIECYISWLQDRDGFTINEL